MAKEIIAVIGAGGKTTALGILAKQSGKSAVLITTTTHIFPLVGIPCFRDPCAEELRQPGILCAGSSAKEGKLRILPREVLSAAMEQAALVVYEGDGAHGLPLKLHRSDEPVILPETTHCLIVAGLSSLGQPIEKAVHRYALRSDWNPRLPVGADTLVACVWETAQASGLPLDKIKVFLNQADALASPALAMDAAEILQAMGLDARYGSLQDPPDHLYRWVTGG